MEGLKLYFQFLVYVWNMLSEMRPRSLNNNVLVLSTSDHCLPFCIHTAGFHNTLNDFTEAAHEKRPFLR